MPLRDSCTCFQFPLSLYPLGLLKLTIVCSVGSVDCILRNLSLLELVGYKGFTYNLEYDSYVFKSNVGAFKLYDATSWALVATISPNTVNGVFYTNPTENKLWDRVGSGPPNGYLQLFETLGTYGIPTGVDPVTSQPYFWRIK